MTSFAVVGLRREEVKNIAQMLAKNLDFEYIDLNVEFEDCLINNFDFPLSFADDILQTQETKCLSENVLRQNVVLNIADDMFLSNNNYKLFGNIKVILIEFDEQDKIKQNIQKLLKKHSNIHIKYNNLKINDLITLIRG